MLVRVTTIVMRIRKWCPVAVQCTFCHQRARFAALLRRRGRTGSPNLGSCQKTIGRRHRSGFDGYGLCAHSSKRRIHDAYIRHSSGRAKCIRARGVAQRNPAALRAATPRSDFAFHCASVNLCFDPPSKTARANLPKKVGLRYPDRIRMSSINVLLLVLSVLSCEKAGS